MRWLLLLGTSLALISPAEARLQLSISSGGSTFTCFDGQAGCDLSPGANNLLVIGTTLPDGAFAQVTLAQSQFGAPEELQLSSSNIRNGGLSPVTITITAGDTSFAPPMTVIKESGSLTFNDAVGSGLSTLSFFGDHLNGQGAPATPGTPLFSTSGAPATNPDSFAGTNFSPFVTTLPFSMTESASVSLIAGGSITGLNQSMETVTIPEPKSWVMMLSGFALLAGVGLVTRRRTPRLAV